MQMGARCFDELAARKSGARFRSSAALLGASPKVWLALRSGPKVWPQPSLKSASRGEQTRRKMDTQTDARAARPVDWLESGEFLWACDDIAPLD